MRYAITRTGYRPVAPLPCHRSPFDECGTRATVAARAPQQNHYDKLEFSPSPAVAAGFLVAGFLAAGLLEAASAVLPVGRDTGASESGSPSSTRVWSMTVLPRPARSPYAVTAPASRSAKS